MTVAATSEVLRWDWPQIVVTTAAVVAALSYLAGWAYRHAVKPVVEFASDGKDLLDGMKRLLPMVPLIEEVVGQTRLNGGGTLADKIEATHDGVALAVALAEDAKTAAEVAAEKVEKVARKLATVSKTQAEHRRYVHDNFHAFKNSLTVLQGAAALDMRRHEAQDRKHPRRKGDPKVRATDRKPGRKKEVR